jgi:hypothetical protein
MHHFQRPSCILEQRSIPVCMRPCYLQGLSLKAIINGSTKFHPRNMKILTGNILEIITLEKDLSATCGRDILVNNLHLPGAHQRVHSPVGDSATSSHGHSSSNGSHDSTQHAATGSWRGIRRRRGMHRSCRRWGMRLRSMRLRSMRHRRRV